LAITMSQYSLQATDPFDRAVTKRYATTSGLLDVLGVRKVAGLTFRYRQQDRLPGIEWRRANEGYAESTGLIVPRVEELKTFGGRFFIDELFLRNQRTGRDAIDLQAEQASLKAIAAARELERSIIEGDDLVDPDELMGIRRRATGNQVILAGAGGATLTLSMVDSLIDAMSRQAGTLHLFGPKAVRRKFTDLARAQGNSVQVNYSSIQDLGEQITRYDGVPFHVVEDDWDTTTILDAEDPGDGTSDTYSMYALAAGDEMGVQLLAGGGGNGDGPIARVESLGKAQQGPPGEIWQMDMDAGLATKHPRSIGRLRAILV
jgi:hypothetical protein